MTNDMLMDELEACTHCGHRAWAHGEQSGFPATGEPCHAAPYCECPGYAR